MARSCGLRTESPKGISSAIIPISKEDHESTKGKSIIINASDNQILAGKEEGDGYIFSNNPLEGEKVYQPDSCKKDKLLNGEGEGSADRGPGYDYEALRAPNSFQALLHLHT
ncbi:hypothetical protein V6N11_053274 [Hibiscus sabdariffa]|uniref:Uncharacterized protein n=1 Tax=Hibiscus sabdariffa TaxID=183260 RepID=A0ABR2UCH5_9ROSI